ncbi:hypothetical protein E2C01_084867 [Portunus trituberculatus]|uniref:Uncharacterized protein n=1 Tax=Portunus trituberculatus TaxID=210409 RepID=A0A5B7JC22_PORTR|nr:hypothetical protein [Portunus trituberculatus]
MNGPKYKTSKRKKGDDMRAAVHVVVAWVVVVVWVCGATRVPSPIRISVYGRDNTSSSNSSSSSFISYTRPRRNATYVASVSIPQLHALTLSILRRVFTLIFLGYD